MNSEIVYLNFSIFYYLNVFIGLISLHEINYLDYKHIE